MRLARPYQYTLYGQEAFRSSSIRRLATEKHRVRVTLLLRGKHGRNARHEHEGGRHHRKIRTALSPLLSLYSALCERRDHAMVIYGGGGASWPCGFGAELG